MIFKAPEKNAILKSGYGINSTFFQYIHPWAFSISSDATPKIEGKIIDLYFNKVGLASLKINKWLKPNFLLKPDEISDIYLKIILCKSSNRHNKHGGRDKFSKKTEIGLFLKAESNKIQRLFVSVVPDTFQTKSSQTPNEQTYQYSVVETK